MQVSYKFFLYPELAARFLNLRPANPRLVWTEVTVTEGSYLYQTIGQVHRRLSSKSPFNAGLFAAWRVKRRYSEAELHDAELFHMRVDVLKRSAMISSEVAYDFSARCPHCRAGGKQVGNLRINTKRLPKKSPLVLTGALEWLVPARVAESLARQGFTGLRLRQVEPDDTAPSDLPEKLPTLSDLNHYPSGQKLIELARRTGMTPLVPNLIQFIDMELWSACVVEHNQRIRAQTPNRHSKALEPWFQLEVVSPPISTCPPTKFGVDPFDEIGLTTPACPLGHSIRGYDLLSEVSIVRSDWKDSDILTTSDLIRPGIPEPLFLVSPRFRKFWVEQGAVGVYFDVAHCV